MKNIDKIISSQGKDLRDITSIETYYYLSYEG